MDNGRILTRAKRYESAMVRFLRDIIAIPSESGQEKRVISRIKREMRDVEELNRLWDPDFWTETFSQVDEWDRLIEDFNRRVGL